MSVNELQSHQLSAFLQLYKKSFLPKNPVFFGDIDKHWLVDNSSLIYTTHGDEIGGLMYYTHCGGTSIEEVYARVQSELLFSDYCEKYIRSCIEDFDSLRHVYAIDLLESFHKGDGFALVDRLQRIASGIFVASAPNARGDPYECYKRYGFKDTWGCTGDAPIMVWRP